jgi:hypothetical protein
MMAWLAFSAKYGFAFKNAATFGSGPPCAA